MQLKYYCNDSRILFDIQIVFHEFVQILQFQNEICIVLRDLMLFFEKKDD